MPYLDLAVGAALLVTLCVGFATRKASPLAVAVMGVAAGVLLGIAFALEGARWQLVSLAVLAVLIGGTVLWARHSARVWPARLTGALLGPAVLVTGGAAWALPPMVLPAPSGPHAVGLASAVWTDDSRGARGTSGGEGHRSLPVTLWYPASGAGGTTAYVPDRVRAEQLAAALAAQYGVPPLLLDGLQRAHGHATLDAPATAGRFPVVVASPGTSSTRWLMRSWAEELASRGNVVIALDHPYDSVTAELDDGTAVRGDLTATGDDARDQALADGWARVRADDISAVIDQVGRGAAASPALIGADPTRIVAAGHSLGGAAAVEATRTDPRIGGVVDIDGMPRSPEGTQLERPAVFLVAGDSDPNPRYGAVVASYLRDESAARVTLDGIAHLGFVDTGLLLAPVPGITGLRGPQGPGLAADATATLLAAVTDRTVPDAAALARVGRLG